MEHYKISKLLNNSSYMILYYLINHLLSGHYYASKNVRFQTSMLRSDLCDYSDTCIIVKGRVNVIEVLMMLTKEIKLSRIMLHLDHAYQNSITHL